MAHTVQELKLSDKVPPKEFADTHHRVDRSSKTRGTALTDKGNVPTKPQ